MARANARMIAIVQLAKNVPPPHCRLFQAELPSHLEISCRKQIYIWGSSMPFDNRILAESENLLIDTVAIIGIVTEVDFEKAAVSLAEFRDYCSYDEYMALRESLQLGLSTGGLVVTSVYMSLSTLVLWRKFAAKPESDGRPIAHDLWIAALTDLTIDG
jgi:hypothetical protein